MDIQKMMQQAQQMQQKMQELQGRVASMEVTGTSGGGMVEVIATCKGDILNVSIDPSAINPDDKEILEDLIKAAINDAKSKADKVLEEETKSMMGEMGLPSNIQLPF